MSRRRSFTPIRWIIKTPREKVRRIKIGQPPYRAITRAKALRPRKKWLPPKPTELVIHRRGGRKREEGYDPETRAVPHWKVRGTLPERIMYKSLTDRGYLPDIDFDFQSSLQGGRLELGGIEADFLFKYRRIIIQVNGPTHLFYIRFMKDLEQRDILQDYGYSVLEISDQDVLNGGKLEDFLRRNLDTSSRGGAGALYRNL